MERICSKSYAKQITTVIQEVSGALKLTAAPLFSADTNVTSEATFDILCEDLIADGCCYRAYGEIRDPRIVVAWPRRLSNRPRAGIRGFIGSGAR